MRRMILKKTRFKTAAIDHSATSPKKTRPSDGTGVYYTTNPGSTDHFMRPV